MRDDARDLGGALECRRGHGLEQLGQFGGGAPGRREGGLVVVESGCFHGGNARRERVEGRLSRYHTRPMSRDVPKPDATLLRLARV